MVIILCEKKEMKNVLTFKFIEISMQKFHILIMIVSSSLGRGQDTKCQDATPCGQIKYKVRSRGTNIKKETTFNSVQDDLQFKTCGYYKQKSKRVFWFYFSPGVTLSNSRGLLLALSSRISPGKALSTTFDFHQESN